MPVHTKTISTSLQKHGANANDVHDEKVNNFVAGLYRDTPNFNMCPYIQFKPQANYFHSMIVWDIYVPPAKENP